MNESNTATPSHSPSVNGQKSSTRRLVLGGDAPLRSSSLWNFASAVSEQAGHFSLQLHPAAESAINTSHAFLERLIASEKPYYGINTGFGYFADRRIERDKLVELQTNIVRSHCCNVGTPLPRDLVFGMWLVTLNKLCQGHSGIRLETVQQILAMLERGILAVVPSRGSVGASGDLSPSAHATRAILGEGMCSVPAQGQFITIPASEALANCGLPAITLGPKEGLSLINGTSLSSILAIKAWHEGRRLLKVANASAALAIEAMGASTRIAHPAALAAHRHQGTLETGRELMKYFEDGPSEMRQRHLSEEWVQDPYSFRCVPQVHGAVWEELRHAEQTLDDEINAATDNPLLVASEEEVYNCGHFHAIYPARASDAIASALTTLASISERRINHAMCAKRKHLPTFLINDGGLNSGFMMAHVTAAALVSESQSSCFPASVNTIPTNIQQEDHVSMGPIAGFKALQIVDHLRNVLAIELLCMAQAFDLQRPLRSTPRLELLWEKVRAVVPKLEQDRSLSEDIEEISQAIAQGQIVDFDKE
jgi:histidine ammonia-lyase